MRKAGRAAEAAAAHYLEQKGYAVLQCNAQCGRAEFDLVAMDGATLVFVEVKARSSHRFGWPETYVDAKKQRILLQGAERYIEESSYIGEARFDVIAIRWPPSLRGTWKFRHFVDAFYG